MKRSAPEVIDLTEEPPVKVSNSSLPLLEYHINRMNNVPTKVHNDFTACLNELIDLTSDIRLHVDIFAAERCVSGLVLYAYENPLSVLKTHKGWEVFGRPENFDHIKEFRTRLRCRENNEELPDGFPQDPYYFTCPSDEPLSPSEESIFTLEPCSS